MAEYSEPSLDQTMELARRLAPRDQVRLVAQLVAILADARQGPSAISSDAWEAWASLRAEITQQASHLDLHHGYKGSSVAQSEA